MSVYCRWRTLAVIQIRSRTAQLFDGFYFLQLRTAINIGSDVLTNRGITPSYQKNALDSVVHSIAV